MVLLLHLASAPGGLSECVPGAVSVAGKDAVLCLSVLPCWVSRGWWGCAGSAQGFGYKLSSSLAWGEEHSSSRVMQELLCKEQIPVHSTWLWACPELLSPAQAEVNLFLAGLQAGEAEQRV